MTCPICNHELPQNESFCPQCGFEIHILPEGVSDAVKVYENARITNYIKIWDTIQNTNTTLQKQEEEKSSLQTELSSSQEKLQIATQQVADLTKQISSAQKEINSLEAQLKAKQGSIAKFLSNISDLTKIKEEDRERLARITDERDKLNAQYRDLSNKMSEAQYAIQQLESRLQTLITEKERLEGLLAQQQSNPQSNTSNISASSSHNSNNRERKGEVEFVDKSIKIKQNIYEGTNIYALPTQMRSSYQRDVFSISLKDGRYVIKDCCGALKKANGRSVHERGEELFNGDLYNIGSIQIIIHLPEFNLDNITL